MQQNEVSRSGISESGFAAVSELDNVTFFGELVENLACPRSRLSSSLVARAFLIDWQSKPTSIL
jgi:hypothetical protein